MQILNIKQITRSTFLNGNSLLLELKQPAGTVSVFLCNTFTQIMNTYFSKGFTNIRSQCFQPCRRSLFMELGVPVCIQKFKAVLGPDFGLNFFFILFYFIFFSWQFFSLPVNSGSVFLPVCPCMILFVSSQASFVRVCVCAHACVQSLAFLSLFVNLFILPPFTLPVFLWIFTTAFQKPISACQQQSGVLFEHNFLTCTCRIFG